MPVMGGEERWGGVSPYRLVVLFSERFVCFPIWSRPRRTGAGRGRMGGGRVIGACPDGAGAAWDGSLAAPGRGGRRGATRVRGPVRPGGRCPGGLAPGWDQGLHPVQRPQRLLHLPHHRGRLRSAAQDGGQVGVGEIGEAEAVAGMRFRADDLDGEHGLGRVDGVERGDGGHGDHVAGVDGVLGVFGRVGEGLAEGCEDFSGEAWGEGLEGVHWGAVRVFGGEVGVCICDFKV